MLYHLELIVYSVKLAGVRPQVAIGNYGFDHKGFAPKPGSPGTGRGFVSIELRANIRKRGRLTFQHQIHLLLDC
jgi:hypothetical protein